MKRSGLLAVTLLIASGVVASASPIQIVLFEDFQGAVTDGFVTSPGVIPGTIFSLVQGTIDVVGPSFFPALCSNPSFGNCIDTEGSTGTGNPTLGQIQTTSSTLYTPGWYVLNFVLTGWSNPGTPADNEGATVQVSLGSLVNQSFSVNGANNPYQKISIPFLVGSDTNASLNFMTTAVTAGYAGAILDNIEIDAVPEPASLALVGFGIGSLGLAIKRRRSVR